MRSGRPREPGKAFKSVEGEASHIFTGLGAMDVTKPYRFRGCGAMDVTKPYKFIGFGFMDVTKPHF